MFRKDTVPDLERYESQAQREYGGPFGLGVSIGDILTAIEPFKYKVRFPLYLALNTERLRDYISDDRDVLTYEQSEGLWEAAEQAGDAVEADPRFFRTGYLFYLRTAYDTNKIMGPFLVAPNDFSNLHLLAIEALMLLGLKICEKLPSDELVCLAK